MTKLNDDQIDYHIAFASTDAYKTSRSIKELILMRNGRLYEYTYPLGHEQHEGRRFVLEKKERFTFNQTPVSHQEILGDTIMSFGTEIRGHEKEIESMIKVLNNKTVQNIAGVKEARGFKGFCKTFTFSRS